MSHNIVLEPGFGSWHFYQDLDFLAKSSPQLPIFNVNVQTVVFWEAIQPKSERPKTLYK